MSRPTKKDTPTRSPDEFNHHGFGPRAVETVAAALYHDVGDCSGCGPDDLCEVEHFYPHAESALRGLEAVVLPGALGEHELRVVEGRPTPDDHRRCLLAAVEKIVEGRSCRRETSGGAYLWKYVVTPSLRFFHFVRRLFASELAK